MDREEILAEVQKAVIYETNPEKIKPVTYLERDPEEFD